jgi:SecD/SecF fusion protein
MLRILLQLKGNNPLFDKIIAQGGGPVLGLFSKTLLQLMDILKIGYKVLLPAEQRYAKFVWGETNYNTR